MLQKQFETIINLIQNARNNAIRQANSTLIELYYEVGKYITTEVRSTNWGKGVIKELAYYIQQNYPTINIFVALGASLRCCWVLLWCVQWWTAVTCAVLRNRISSTQIHQQKLH